MKRNNSRELRLLVTQRCNYNCVFCHGEGLQNIQQDNLTADDFAYVYKSGKDAFGFETVTITGGEPLIREDIIDIVKKIKREGGKIVLTTNGFFLNEKIEIGKYLDRINISLHALNDDEYKKIVRVDKGFEKVMNGLLNFRRLYPKVEIRLNATLIEGMNTSKEKMEKYIRLAENLNASIKFVELFPKESNGFFPLEKAEEVLIELGFSKIGTEDRKRDFMKGAVLVRLSKIFCAFVENSNDSCKLCKKYNDLFITPSGSIKPCRSQKRMIDILEDTKNKNSVNLTKKIGFALAALGNKCSYP